MEFKDTEKAKKLAEVKALIQERIDYYSRQIKQYHEEKQQLENKHEENTKKIIIDVLNYDV
jgi:hypothetical protein